MVCLRLIRELPASAIAIDPVRERNDREVEAVRISRLGTPFRYRLTQQLAAVFSDIGLPSEFEMSRKDLLSELGAQVCNSAKRSTS